MIVNRLAVLLTLTLTIAACASEVVRTSTPLGKPGSVDPRQIELTEDANIRLPTGYSRTLPGGSTWELRGAVAQGATYKRTNGIFTVEGAHVHEAYIVVSGARLVGFYLPVEQAYSEIQPVALKLK